MVIAKLNNLRIATRKVRQVIDLIRGLDVLIAEAQLKNLHRRAALPILKLLQSAVANAENNFKFKKDNLYIKEIKADEGTKLKRWMPKAMGRATPIHKQNSHVTIILEEKIKTAHLLSDKKETTPATVVQSLKNIKEETEETSITDKLNKHENPEKRADKKDVKDLSLKNFGSKKGAAKSDKKTNKVKKIFQRKAI